MTLPASTEPTWRLLATTPPEPPAAFDAATLENLPAPAARWLRRVLPEATPLNTGIALRMTGEIRIGRWLPFAAEQILRAGVGFVWKPVVGGHVLRFTGADILGPDDARMEFRLHGVIPVARASGPDTARSAAGRLAAETVAWVPQALTPQAGARWMPVDDASAIVTVAAADRSIDVEITVDAEGQLGALRLQRWNDSTDPPALQHFGGEVHSEYVLPSGVRIAGTGDVGWGFGTSNWDDGEFFRYTIIDAASPPVPPSDQEPTDD